MKIKITLLVLFAASIVSAQRVKIASANKKFDDLAYVDAISIYENVAKKGFKSPDLFQKLGDANYFNANLKEANKWYAELFALNQKVDSEYYYRYAQTLKSVGDYTKADEYLKSFAQSNADDIRAKLYNDNKDYLAQLKNNSNRYDVEDAGINSKYSDYGAAFYNGKLVFTSSRDTGGVSKMRNKWTNQSYSNLFQSEVDAEGHLKTPEPLGKKVNSKYNESSPVFTKDGRTMYFTRNNFINGKKQKDGKDVILLKLYKATFDGFEWNMVEELPFNSNQYNCAHPALSPDDKILYFASNMPGSLGQSDIFKVKINKDGSFGAPENLGKEINTEARETFPFISDENELLFASDGQLGFGGLDVFAVKINKDGSYSKVLNVGAPVNSSQDDFAYFIDSKSRFGFFSSNRDGGKGFDDIYRFKENYPLVFTCDNNLSGVVVDDETKKPIPNAKVTLFDKDMKSVQNLQANELGEYKFEKLDCSATYFVRGESTDYSVVEKKITTTDKPNDKIKQDLMLPTIKKGLKVGIDLSTTFNLKPIYFDTNKSNIRPDAANELAIVLSVMKQYPEMKIAVKTHTDCRATAEYNRKLSDRRAVSIMNWLVANGIAKNRLTAKGYGESQLINKCADGVKCSEEEHQANRRSEFIVTSMK
jgi:outer membrane protein OmpA-like peptidoglycan-associated protein/tetratricopeptide (TPR) repeat protein